MIYRLLLTVALACTLAGGASADEVIRCTLKPNSPKFSHLIPDWIEIRRTGAFTGTFVTDSIMADRDEKPIRVDIGRENDDILSMTWRGNLRSIRTGGLQLRMPHRLSYVKRNRTARFSVSVTRGNPAHYGAVGRCTTRASS